MDTFLGQVAQRILSEHPHDTDSVLVVFNNHRSELFLRQQFQQLSNARPTPFFLPQTTVIDDLVQQLSGLQIVPNEFLLFELYRIHTEIGGDQRKYQTFEDFIAFGDIMLRDFSEIDRYLVDAHSLFVNLGDLKTIDEWDISSPHLTPFQQQYLQFYRSLHTYYLQLRRRLLSSHQAYNGMAYRHLAENPTLLTPLQQHTHLYFVGFNTLSECERQILALLTRHQPVTLIADSDPYYFYDPQQEAGLFLRRHAQQFPELRPPEAPSHYSQGHKDIHIVECPEQLLQCKYAGQLLATSPWLNNPESTAIVLANEALLLPTLNSLPAGSYGINISMGYPYTESSVHTLVLKILILYRQSTPQGYHHTDLLRLAADPVVCRLAADPHLPQTLARHLEQHSLVRSLPSQLPPPLSSAPLACLLPDPKPSTDQALQQLLLLCRALADNHTFSTNKKEQQALGSLAEILDHLQQLQQQYHYITTLDALELIYTRLAQRHTIDLLGQPLTGLQILGMLETRNLDFQNIILLSANEKTLPAGRTDNTLIPHQLKQHFHLPTHEEKDSVYAYHLFRLLQRAEHIHLLYTTETEATGKGEISRLLLQIIHELAPRYPHTITLTRHTLDTRPRLLVAAPTEARKTAPVLHRLHHLAAHGFSPSSLNLYLTCPLRFYHEKILGIAPIENLADDIDTAQLGTHIHSILQHIYQPLLHQPLQPSHLQQVLDNLPHLLDNEFRPLYGHGRNPAGRNHFSQHIAHTQIQNLLQSEIQQLQQHHTLQIVDLEPERLDPLLLLTTPDGHPVNIIGRPDRIDLFDGQLRIIDYKTGSLTDKELHADLNPDPLALYPKWLQLMTYALFYHHHHPHHTVQIGICPLRQPQAGLQLASWDTPAGPTTTFTPQHLDHFRHLLTQILQHLLDPDIPFLPKPHTDNCRYCPVRAHCPHSLNPSR